jgi:hypothetical protein
MGASDEATAEDRCRRAEAALAEALEERARLWEQLQQRRAAEVEAAELRRLVDQMRASPSWRLTAPLRRAKGFVTTRRDLVRRGLRKLRA